MIECITFRRLGAGTGACGLYAAALGARRVLLTDGSKALLELQEKNLNANERLLVDGSERVAVGQFLWDKQPPPPGPWDLVIGSDLTYAYDPAAHVDLAATISALLSNEATAPRVVLAHQHRNRSPGLVVERWDEGDEMLRAFTAALEERRLRLTHHALLKVGEPDAEECEVSILAVEPS